MITRVEVTTRQGNVLSLPLEEVSNGLLVEEIEGLDPVKATIVSSSFAGLNGEQYHSSKRERRDIKISLGLEPDETVLDTVGAVRRRAYGYFMPQTEVSLRFFSDDVPPVDITGMVESCETPHWAQEPTLVASINCFDPDFIDPTIVTVERATTSTLTEFEIDYDGTVESGLKFVLAVDRTMSEFTIYHNPPNQSLVSMDFAAPLLAGDELTISTVPGDKFATLKRLGVESPIMFGVSPQAKWLELTHGTNLFRVYATGAAVPFEIQYFNRYGGL